MFVLCVVSKDKKGKCRTIKNEETSADEIRTEYKRIQKRNPTAGMDIRRLCFLCVVCVCVRVCNCA